MKRIFTFLVLFFPIFLCSQTESNRIFSVGISTFGSHLHEQQRNRPSGETIPLAGGFGYKIGGLARLPKRNFELSAGLNFKQSYSFLEVIENMSVLTGNNTSSGSQGVSILDRVRQSYIEMPLGISYSFDQQTSLTIGVILQTQIEHCRHRKLFGIPFDATNLEPLVTDVSPGYLGFFLKLENKFWIRNQIFSYDVFFQTNHDEIELPNTNSNSERQLYIGVGLNYFLN